jgi:hypothetical protein
LGQILFKGKALFFSTPEKYYILSNPLYYKGYLKKCHSSENRNPEGLDITGLRFSPE